MRIAKKNILFLFDKLNIILDYFYLIIQIKYKEIFILLIIFFFKNLFNNKII